jgi:hypothetical protein
MKLDLLLHFLFGIALSAPTKSYLETVTDCDQVLSAWKRLGKKIYISDCCEMDGVECDSNSNVISISWISKDFRGSIPGELFKLKELRWL